MLKESIDGILHPSDMKISMLMVLIVAGTAVTKFCLGMYTIKIGKSIGIRVLLAVGEDGRNDSFFLGTYDFVICNIFIYRIFTGCICGYCIFLCSYKSGVECA